MAARYLKKESSILFITTELIFEKMISDHSGQMQVCEDQALYEVQSVKDNGLKDAIKKVSTGLPEKSLTDNISCCTIKP